MDGYHLLVNSFVQLKERGDCYYSQLQDSLIRVNIISYSSNNRFIISLVGPEDRCSFIIV